MPPGYVRTVRAEIFYEYAKLISRSAFAGKINYAFVASRFKALCSCDISISGTNREWRREQELPRECVFCASSEDLQLDHLIPRSRGGSDSADNTVWACRSCNASRGSKGVFQWLGLKDKDRLHRLVAGKYLKLLYELHKKSGTLDVPKEQVDQLCITCRNPETCEEWDKVGKLTCFCLESVF